MILSMLDVASTLNTSSGCTVGALRSPYTLSHQRENAASDVSRRPKTEGCLQEERRASASLKCGRVQGGGPCMATGSGQAKVEPQDGT